MFDFRYYQGPQDNFNYYIATQAPLESTVNDFWRMVWEQHSKVIIMATDLTENGVEKCAEYMPASVVLDNVQTYGNFQVRCSLLFIGLFSVLMVFYLGDTEKQRSQRKVCYVHNSPQTFGNENMARNHSLLV